MTNAGATLPGGPVDEQKIARNALQEMELPFKKGELIPEDFDNPAMGNHGHHCVDPSGRYQPDWFCIQLMNFGKMMPSRQFFCENGDKFFVRVGTWVDVPPQVLSVLQGCVVETVQMDYDGTDLITNDFVPVVVNTMPRFPYTAFPSK